VLLVDQSTGRIFSDRSWRDGLQQAVETCEGITITSENQSIARVSRQRYFRLYGRIVGLTGTAIGSEREFSEVYRLPVVTIPTRRPCRRIELPMRCFKDAKLKGAAIAKEIVRIHRMRQPVLAGAPTIAKSEVLAKQLDVLGIPYQLLNGKQDVDEAHVIALAGQAGAVTIATNMAGRGTDIKLGDGVNRLGGLHVIATEPNASARVDRQLVGRSSRQGDPGSFQIFVSADDQLISRFAPALSRRIRRLAGENGEVPENLSKAIARVQRKVNRLNYLQRRRQFEHDDWLQNVVSNMSGSSDPAFTS